MKGGATLCKRKLGRLRDKGDLLAKTKKIKYRRPSHRKTNRRGKLEGKGIWVGTEVGQKGENKKEGL